MSIVYKLLVAHVLADFFFQTDAFNRGKYARDKSCWKYIGLHSLIHALTAYLLVAQWTLWYIPVVIGISHFIIDTIKCRLNKKTASVFVIDQMAHVVVILLLAATWQELASFILELVNSEDLMKYVLACILMLKPSSVFVSSLLDRWTLDDSGRQSLPSAGEWIGYLERLLILTFVIIGSIDGVGFLLTAKSVFRFGDLNKAKDIKMTEYVMVGTMTSFAIAIITGLLLR